MPRDLFHTALAAALLFLGGAVTGTAQQITTRAEEIEAARRQKAADLKPEQLSGAEVVLLRAKEERWLERFSAGVRGVRLKLGGLVAGSGFALGPEYSRRGLLSGRMDFRTSAVVSTAAFQRFDAELDFPQLNDGRSFANVLAVHRNYPQMQYYGPGPSSSRNGRSDYRLEDTFVDLTLGTRPWRQLNVGLTGGFLAVNVGPGTQDRWVNIEVQYTPLTTPGLDRQSNFTRVGGFIQFDTRDNPAGPRHGTNLVARLSHFEDVKRNDFSHRRLELEGQQYFSLFNGRRTLAFRGNTVLTDVSPGQRVPFYLQPVLGGSEALRGFRPFRFYGNDSMILTAEYRWEVFSGLDMALFTDHGKVVQRRGDLSFDNLEKSHGFGFRFNARNAVFLRLDVGFSREGFQVWFKFNNVF